MSVTCCQQWRVSVSCLGRCVANVHCYLNGILLRVVSIVSARRRCHSTDAVGVTVETGVGKIYNSCWGGVLSGLLTSGEW